MDFAEKAYCNFFLICYTNYYDNITQAPERTYIAANKMEEVFMSTQFLWKNEYNIGVDIIDREHKKLFRIINKMFSVIEHDKNYQWACQESIKYFKGHTLQHFADEEAYMESIQFEGRAMHKRIHDDFRTNTLPALEQELERTSYAPDTVTHFLGVCAGWLVGHTLLDDQAIVGKRKRRWDQNLPHEEHQAVRQLLGHLIFDIFHMDSHMISENYSGEKFGAGFYYRLVYELTDKNESIEILFAFEKNLLINTVGEILRTKVPKLDDTLIHTSRYIAKQIEEQLIQRFAGTENYKLLEENLLSYDQFRQIFETEKIMHSFLFNIGKAGYFAHSVMAPHQLKKNTITPEKTIKPIPAKEPIKPIPPTKSTKPIAPATSTKPVASVKFTEPVAPVQPIISLKHENAIVEVERYLSEMEEQERQTMSQKKILLVDDSITIRQAMSKLLMQDYDIAVANSGMAAIRSITLNMPDLIILDYEMPVCDGRQTLEMIRSEKDFAEIPVIFLTGRRDTNSILQVMSLNVSDYLLKDSKPTDIKKKIDKFFAKQAMNR